MAHTATLKCGFQMRTSTCKQLTSSQGHTKQVMIIIASCRHALVQSSPHQIYLPQTPNHKHVRMFIFHPGAERSGADAGEAHPQHQPTFVTIQTVAMAFDFKIIMKAYQDDHYCLRSWKQIFGIFIPVGGKSLPQNVARQMSQGKLSIGEMSYCKITHCKICNGEVSHCEKSFGEKSSNRCEGGGCRDIGGGLQWGDGSISEEGWSCSEWVVVLLKGVVQILECLKIFGFQITHN